MRYHKLVVSKVDKALAKMRTSRNNVRFSELQLVCDFYFERQEGAGRRRRGTSHIVYKTPWQGDPRVNIQEGRDGKAKPFQVRQILDAIDRLT